jgi:uracil-DNA glycosylase family 4
MELALISMPRNPNCELCPLSEGVETTCVWGEHSNRKFAQTEADVLVIGEAPGHNEDKAGRPFVGDSGRLIREKLEAAGITSYYITNVVRCRPPKNRTPTAQEAKACRVYLDEEIRAVKPKYVIALGSLASKTVLKKSKITQEHGQLVESPGFTGVPIFHPAYALRDPSKLPAIEHDLARLKRAMDGKYEATPKIPWRIVTAANFDQFIREFKEAPEFSFDTETSGLFPHDGKGFVRCLGLGLPKRAWVIPLTMPGGIGSMSLGRLLRRLAAGKVAVAQNGKFDNHWLHYYFGGGFHLDFDTMLAHHTLDENQDHDLKYMARSELDAPEYDLSTKEKTQPKLEDTAVRLKFLEYCATDAWYTLQLYYRFNERLRANRGLHRLFYKLVMPAARALEAIEREGLTLDLPKYAETEQRVRRERDGQLAKLNDLAKAACGREINWNSPQQIAKLLFEDIGLPVTVRTAKGAPSTGEEAMLDLKGKHPVSDQLIKFRELEKFLGTYIEGWKEYIVDGKLYLGYKIHGTVTGRYSSRLHQVPRDDSIRNLVIAPPGWAFCQADLSQAELRIAAELSRDLELVACFQPRGPDVHWRTMLHVIGSGASGEYNELAIETVKTIALGVPKGGATLSWALEELRAAGHDAAIAIDKTWKEARKRGKSINFGFIFGMFENKFIETCKLKYGYEPTWDEAHAFRQAYFELYPGVPKWHEKQKTLCKLDSQVRNLFGRIRRLPGILSRDRELRGEAERQAINSPVQGTIGDWKAAALIEIHDTIDHNKLRIVGEHHDALLMIVRNDPKIQAEVLPRVRAIMRKPKLLETFKIKMAVPMESEIELGAWGAGVKWEN